MTRAARLLVGVLLASLALAAPAAPAGAEGAVSIRRMAVVVGANAAAPGRKPLRFAQRDASAVAGVLREQGGFAAGDIRLLLDPRPGEILRALDAVLAEAARVKADTLILFYYSGHADTTSLYPSGAALPLVALRQRLDDGRAAMRIGIIDSCRGGGWTGSKGLSESQAFDIEEVLDLATEGSVLIASSSGMEDAHESAALRGSFFTHHWNAALRGAADRNGDDKVTVGEAFEYARTLTIRDTALETENPQHPSFRFNLRGRGDPPLAELSAGSSVIELTQEQGPLQVIHLGTGLLVAELPPGRRSARVSLSPGHYLVRRRAGRAVLAREVRLGARRRIAIDEAGLAEVQLGSLESKGALAAEPPSLLERDDDPPDEISFSYTRVTPNYQVLTGWNSDTPDSWANTDESWSVKANYLLRHGRYLGTRFGLGFVRPENYGDGAIAATVGESLSWPLFRKRDFVPWSSSHVIEPYLAVDLTARGEIDRNPNEIPYVVQYGVAGGVRLSLLYVQVGYTGNIVPNKVTFDQGDTTAEQLEDFKPSLTLEAGLRMSFGAGGGGRKRLVGR